MDNTQKIQSMATPYMQGAKQILCPVCKNGYLTPKNVKSDFWNTGVLKLVCVSYALVDGAEVISPCEVDTIENWEAWEKENPHSPYKVSEQRKKIMKFSLTEKAQGMVEYALILVLVAVVVIVALSVMGPLVKDIFATINESL